MAGTSAMSRSIQSPTSKAWNANYRWFDIGSGGMLLHRVFPAPVSVVATHQGGKYAAVVGGMREKFKKPRPRPPFA